MLRFLRVFAEFIAAFLGLVLLAVMFVAWRLSAHPVNSAFFTPYIEAGIARYIPDARPQIAHSLVTWDNKDHSITLHADGLVIKNGKDRVVAEVPNLDMRLSFLGLMVGQFWPTELTVDHPQIKLERHADGKLYFVGMTADADANDASDDSREALKRVMRSLTRAYAMRHLSVYRAAIEVRDEATGSSWSVSVPEISLKHSFTQLLGTAKLDLTQKEQPATVELHYSYDHLKGLHEISTQFESITPSQFVGGHPETLGIGAAAIFDLPLSGEMGVAFDPDLNIADAGVKLHGGAGYLMAPDLWDKPRSVRSVDIEGEYDHKAQKLNLAVADFDFDGAKLSVTASGHVPKDPRHDLDFTMAAHIADWPMDAYGDLWPKVLVPDARDWIMRNLAKGNYDKGDATFTGSLAWNDLANIDVTSGQGKVSASHGNVSYIDGMPPVENVSAEADFDLNEMKVRVTDGGIGDLRLQPFTITISGLADPDQIISIPLTLTGPIADVVKLIDHPPLRYAQLVGLGPDALSGMAQGVVTLRLPLLKSLATKDVEANASAHLTNVASSQLVKGVELSQGDLALDLDKDGFTVKGPVSVNKIPVQLALQELFHEQVGKALRQIDVSGVIRDDQWKMLGTDSLAGTRGSAVVTLHLTQPGKDKTLFSGTADLTGADLRFDPLRWKKPPGMAAMLQFDAERAEGKNKDIVVKSIALHSTQAHAQGKAVLGADGSVKSVSFDPLVVGRTSAAVSFRQADDDGTMQIEAHGKSLDISGVQSGKGAGNAEPQPIEFRLKVDNLYTSESGVITQAEGYAVRDEEGWSEISLHGLADGEHKLAIDLTPQADGTRSLSVTCDDFGKMLKGLGVTDTVRDGDIKITGSSTVEYPRVINGNVRIGSFSVSNLPVLMTVLSATSPFGFADMVTNRVSFDRLKGAFRWAGDEIELRQVNARGTIGMNVEGKVDLNSNTANLDGTIVPFSTVNRIIGSIPLVGDILTGGDGGGVLAVSYDIKGALSDPKVSVNPVSLLTPGFLRNLFFGGDSEDDNAVEKIVPDDYRP